MCLLLVVLSPSISSDSIVISGTFTPTGYVGENITISSELPTNNSVGSGFNPSLCVNVSNDLGNNMTITFRTNATGAWGDIGTNYTNDTLREYEDTGTDAFTLRYANSEYGQSFTIGTTSPHDDFYLKRIQVYMKKHLGSPGILYFYIKNTNASGWPTGSVLASGSINSSNFSTSYVWRNVNLSPNCFLEKGVKYALYLLAPDLSDGVNEVMWQDDNSGGGYSGGCAFWNISGWANNPANDMFFKVYGSINTSSMQYCQANNSMNQLGTTYWWSVNVTDEIGWNNETYSFTTYNEISFSNPFPSNESWVDIDNHAMNITVSNPGGDAMDVYFYWNNDTLIGSNLSVANNTVANVTIGFNYVRYQQYTWYVVVMDNTSSIWWFKGEAYDWDILRDAVINYLDASSLTGHYGETGDIGWIRDDIIEDGVVNYLDASSLTSHYGESY